MKNNAYVAHGELPIVLCAYGETPGKAMKKMAKLIDKYLSKDDSYLVLGMNSDYDENGIFCMNATISPWR
jgi:hypothetical protein